MMTCTGCGFRGGLSTVSNIASPYPLCHSCWLSRHSVEMTREIAKRCRAVYMEMTPASWESCSVHNRGGWERRVVSARQAVNFMQWLKLQDYAYSTEWEVFFAGARESLRTPVQTELF